MADFINYCQAVKPDVDEEDMLRLFVGDPPLKGLLQLCAMTKQKVGLSHLCVCILHRSLTARVSTATCQGIRVEPHSIARMAIGLLVYLMDNGPLLDRPLDVLPKVDPHLYSDINFSVHILSEKGSREDAFKLLFFISERVPSVAKTSLVDNSVALDRYEAWHLSNEAAADTAAADAAMTAEDDVICT